MMEYENFGTRSAAGAGSFDALIEGGGSTFHPDDRQSFIDAFSRENLLAAHEAGKKVVIHEGRQRGDDGVYHKIQTIVTFVNDENGDVCEITLAHKI